MTNGGTTLVDATDYEYFNKWKWQNIGGYAKRCVYVSTEKVSPGKFRSVNKLIALHREINKTPERCITDHINGNKLDNRRANLRTVNRSQNAHNVGKRNNGSVSTFSGVQPNGNGKRWKAIITMNYHDIYLGTFDDPEDAHMIYLAAKEQLIW